MANGRAGPPFKDIKKVEFEKLCSLQCTQQEICDFFDVDHKTLTRWCKRTYKKDYSQVYMEKRSGGRIALRRLQFRLAEKSAAMAIFLGKIYSDSLISRRITMLPRKPRRMRICKLSLWQT